MGFSILYKIFYKSHGVPVEVGHNDGDRQCDTKNLVRMKSYFFFQSLLIYFRPKKNITFPFYFKTVIL